MLSAAVTANLMKESGSRNVFQVPCVQMFEVMPQVNNRTLVLSPASLIGRERTQGGGARS